MLEVAGGILIALLVLFVIGAILSGMVKLTFWLLERC